MRNKNGISIEATPMDDHEIAEALGWRAYNRWLNE